MPVHPHVRGEDLKNAQEKLLGTGSPPRAWGRPEELRELPLCERFTPTCVGKTPRGGLRFSRGSVHPHVRGEDEVREEENRVRIGSPPRAWGRRLQCSDGHGLFRFTPTCVGKTRGRVGDGTHPSVHPHVRGEDFGEGIRFPRDTGSPPRAWGRRHYPAGGARSPGSPPRAWGRHGVEPVGGPAQRFTPTCVGKTGVPRAPCPPWSVHPHVRGEDSAAAAATGGSFGSPPRAWGRRRAWLIMTGKLRFTPTCVGKTRARPPARRPPSVHPHVRGEDGYSIDQVTGNTGSPPRAWGRRCDRVQEEG